eukprot:jgi/Galph1/2174/GphlegSOOS_G859.1
MLKVGRLLKPFKFLDAFPKTTEDFRVQTNTGGILSVVFFSVTILLFLSETRRYLKPETTTRLVVDLNRDENFEIHLDIVFHHLGCDALGLDAMDATGDSQLEIMNSRLLKYRIEKDGNSVIWDNDSNDWITVKQRQNIDQKECKSCYGAELAVDHCCNTCEEVLLAYELRGWSLALEQIAQCEEEGVVRMITKATSEGCRFQGSIEVAKVGGNFHFVPGHSYISKSGKHLHDLKYFTGRYLNLSHTIQSLSFGQPFPGVKNPLDDLNVVYMNNNEMGVHEYFIKVVPTTYKYLNGRVVHSNQFSVTDYYRYVHPVETEKKCSDEKQSIRNGSSLSTGVFFFYEPSPIRIEYIEQVGGCAV